MRAAHVLLLCILGASLLPSVICNQAVGPDDCCFELYPRRINKRLVKSYYMTDNRCAKAGAILVTQKARHICADPNLAWVQSIMKSVDESAF